MAAGIGPDVRSRLSWRSRRPSVSSSSSTLALAELRDGLLYRFADWPNPKVPNGRIGVYTVWGGEGTGGHLVRASLRHPDYSIRAVTLFS
jgi:hypothetical protein